MTSGRNNQRNMTAPVSDVGGVAQQVETDSDSNESFELGTPCSSAERSNIGQNICDTSRLVNVTVASSPNRQQPDRRLESERTSGSYSQTIGRNDGFGVQHVQGQDRARTSYNSGHHRDDFSLGGSSVGARRGQLDYSRMQSADSHSLNDVTHIQLGPPGIKKEIFEKVCKEVAMLKQELNRRSRSNVDFVQMDQQNQRLEDECRQLKLHWERAVDANRQLKEQLQKTRSMLILDENSMPMEPKQVILLREENERLMNKVALLEQRLEGNENHSPTNAVQHIPSPENSDFNPRNVPNIDGLLQQIKDQDAKYKKLLKERDDLQKECVEMHSTVAEVFDYSENDLHKLVKTEQDRNKELVDENKLLRCQLTTYKDDFDAEKMENRRKESMWDHKFTALRAENDRYQRQMKEKEMEIMRLHAQYQKEFDSKMKIQEGYERKKHVPYAGATEAPQTSQRFGQSSAMTSDMSYELNTCPHCSKTFNSIAMLADHKKQCG